MSSETEISNDITLTGSDPAYYRIFVAALNSNKTLVGKDQAQNNGPFQPDFFEIDAGPFSPSQLQANITLEGYVTILAVDPNNDLMFLSENKIEEPGRFHDAVNLGRPNGVNALSSLVLARGLNGLSNVFGLNLEGDQGVWWKYRNPYTITQETITVTPPGTTTPIEITVDVPTPPKQPWSDWTKLPGALTQVTAGHNGDGRLILAGVNAQGRAYLIFQSSEHPQLPEKWGEWSDITGDLGGFTQITLAMDSRTLVYVFATVDNVLYKCIQDQVSGETFSSWLRVATFENTISSFSVGKDKSDNLYLAVQVEQTNGTQIYGMHQITTSPSTWTQPELIGERPVTCALTLQQQSDQTLKLFAYNAQSHSLDYLSRHESGYWTASWTNVGTDLLNAAITIDITPNTGDNG